MKRKTLRCAECGALAPVLVSGKPLCWDHFDVVIARQVKATVEHWKTRGWDPATGQRTSRRLREAPRGSESLSEVSGDERRPNEEKREQGDLF
jgi:hypothetical protein